MITINFSFLINDNDRSTNNRSHKVNSLTLSVQHLILYTDIKTSTMSTMWIKQAIIIILFKQNDTRTIVSSCYNPILKTLITSDQSILCLSVCISVKNKTLLGIEICVHYTLYDHNDLESSTFVRYNVRCWTVCKTVLAYLYYKSF